jgi:gamma-glutamyltranspeptidase
MNPKRVTTALVAEHSGDTSYFAVADGGNAVSFIHSLSAFGSGVVAGDTGVIQQPRRRGFIVRRIERDRAGAPPCTLNALSSAVTASLARGRHAGRRSAGSGARR